MKIGLIDLDKSENFPNLALMKISAFHKKKNDSVEWYQPLFGGEYDIVYISKIFSWSLEYPYEIRAKKVIKGGIAYGLDNKLPEEVEHLYPDYSLYSFTKNKAYGFLSRGCPRACSFCNVSFQQGKQARKVADLSEFWQGQKEIILLDPNILAVPEWSNLFQQLIKSKARVEFSQGLDIRLMTKEKAEMLNKIKIKMIHFAWDQYNIKTFEKLKEFRSLLNFKNRELGVYILVNFDTTLKEDLDRIYKLKAIGYTPYVMRYKSPNLKIKNLENGNIYNKLARWVNRKHFFNKFETFEEYLNNAY